MYAVPADPNRANVVSKFLGFPTTKRRQLVHGQGLAISCEFLHGLYLLTRNLKRVSKFLDFENLLRREKTRTVLRDFMGQSRVIRQWAFACAGKVC
jgi:hypothetical protein